jgi:hypothetical protein
MFSKNTCSSATILPPKSNLLEPDDVVVLVLLPGDSPVLELLEVVSPQADKLITIADIKIKAARR